MTKPPKINNSIGNEINLFIRQIESLKEVLPITLFGLHAMRSSSKKSLDEFVAKHQHIDRAQNPPKITIPAVDIRRFLKVQGRHENAMLAQTLVPRSLFVTLVSQYDAFLGRLLKTILVGRIELLNASEKTITFAAATAFNSIEAIRDHVIEKEIEGVLRTSHTDHFKWMEKRFNLSLTKGLDIFPQFIELTERRNLFVHADGVVSSHYISTCKEKHFSLGSEVTEGTQLQVTKAYFDESASCLLVLGIMLGQVLWRKIFPEECESADQYLLETTYGLIDRGDYLSAIKLLDFACNMLKNFHSEWYRIALVLNRAQAYKWAGDSNKCNEILSQYDWSALIDSFQLGNAVLKGDWLSSASLMRNIGSNGSVKKRDYEDWPIFREFRSTPEFLEVYQEVFSEPFAIDISEIQPI